MRTTGSGKSTLIARLVRAFLQPINKKPEVIIITCVVNRAVDSIAEKLAQNKINFVCEGSDGMGETCKRHTISSLVKRDPRYRAGAPCLSVLFHSLSRGHHHSFCRTCMHPRAPLWCAPLVTNSQLATGIPAFFVCVRVHVRMLGFSLALASSAKCSGLGADSRPVFLCRPILCAFLSKPCVLKGVCGGSIAMSSFPNYGTRRDQSSSPHTHACAAVFPHRGKEARQVWAGGVLGLGAERGHDEGQLPRKGRR